MEVLSDLDCSVAAELRLIGYTIAEIARVMYCDPRTIRRSLMRRGLMKSSDLRDVQEDYERILGEVKGSTGL